MPQKQAPGAAWARLTSTSEKGLDKNPDGRRQSPKSVENLESGTGKPETRTGKPESGDPKAGTSTRHLRSRPEKPERKTVNPERVKEMDDLAS